MAGISATIQEKYGTLTKKQKTIADHMLRNDEEMCFITLKQLSADVGCSEMTILNLCTALGYGNFNEVKYEFRKQAASRRRETVSRDDASYDLPYIPRGELDDSSGLFSRMAQEELDGIAAFFGALRAEEYYRAARMVCTRKRVLLLGRGVSCQLAKYMLTRLTMNGVACMAVDTESGDEVQSALHFIDQDALVIAISFPDYYFMTTRLAQFAKSRGAALLGITDSSRSELAGLCDMCLCCPTGTRLFLNSLTTPMLAANFLTMAVSVEMNRRSDGRESVTREFSRIFDGGFNG